MGRVIMSGIVPTLKAPVTGVLASSLAVGSTVKLMEGGTAVEYLVVNQGKPSGSSLYDDSCDGTWLLRKYIYAMTSWHWVDRNVYETSTINTYLNDTFFNGFGSVEQEVIKQVKIPYRSGGGSGGTDQSGANGLSCKAFLLGVAEVGGAGTYGYSTDGAKLSYFESGTGDSAKEKRIAYYSGAARDWWFRSPYIVDTDNVGAADRSGNFSGSPASVSSVGMRPALILPKTALFDETTMILKGVK